MAMFHPLTVTEVRRETRDSVVLTLDVPEEQKDAFRFTQGQYLTFRATLDGEEVRRSYSICAAAHESFLRVGIKKITDGLFSTWANTEVRPGQTLEAMPPMGNFFVPLDPANRKRYVGFASGSGITPLLSIIKTTLAAEPQSSFSLFYGNRASSTIMFREELEYLKNEHLQRFSLIHVLSREQQDVDLFNGRIDKEKCRQLLERWLDVASVDTAFICGPQDMMLQVSESLQEHGLDKRQIKFELFATADAGRRPRKPKAEAAEARQDLCQATVVIDGRARSFELEKNTATVLDAAMHEGMEVPYACKAGVCSTCRAMLAEGQVDMDANYALEDYEIARGYILTCQAYPVSDRIVVDFDK
ncbi:MAG TPA: 1,2-phenylacetyl-CoA epoxidase subunit PaaE [Geminicoccaceae bacterium]|nr:1,2-phenylacetyl-CoA epoxidase subunit PaaE [Geminicoccaceae bacterium]